jgi:hypothetical protein
MATTYREVAYSVLESYKKTNDDSTVQLSQILFYIQVIVNRLRQENKKDISGSRYLTIFSSITVETDSKGKKYIDLPTDIMDMDHEKGLQYITYNYETGSCCTGANFSQVQFQPTTPAESMRLMMDEYEKPSSKQPYFYRVTGANGCNNVDRVYFLGLECIDVPDVELGLVCSQSSSQVCDLDDAIPLPDWLIEDLLVRLTNLGRFILIAPQERVNEGSDLTRRSINQVPETGTPPPTEEQMVAAAQNRQSANQRMQNQIDNG